MSHMMLKMTSVLSTGKFVAMRVPIQRKPMMVCHCFLSDEDDETFSSKLSTNHLCLHQELNFWTRYL